MTHIIMALWGEQYIDDFFRYSLPSLLTPNNLPAYCKKHNSIFHFWTLASSFREIQERMYDTTLSAWADIQFHFLDDVDLDSFPVKDDGINLMIEAHRRAIRDAAEGDALLFLCPDMIIADGGLDHVASIAGTGPKAIMIVGLRVTREIAIRGSLAKYGARRMVQGILSFLHPFESACRSDSQNFNTRWPNKVIFPVDERGFVVRNFHWHPLLLTKIGDILPKRTVDFWYLDQVITELDDYHLITDSDDFCCCTLTPRDHFKGTPYHDFPPATFSMDVILEWAEYQATPTHRWFSMHLAKFHNADIPADWGEKKALGPTP